LIVGGRGIVKNQTPNLRRKIEKKYVRIRICWFSDSLKLVIDLTSPRVPELNTFQTGPVIVSYHQICIINSNKHKQKRAETTFRPFY
jgi:hypothetical protein